MKNNTYTLTQKKRRKKHKHKNNHIENKGTKRIERMKNEAKTHLHTTAKQREEKMAFGNDG